jgi:hypothetical protein
MVALPDLSLNELNGYAHRNRYASALHCSPSFRALLITVLTDRTRISSVGIYAEHLRGAL